MSSPLSVSEAPGALVAPVQAILRSAGQLILAAEETGFAIEQKSDRNFVTEVDLAVQKQIVGQLTRLTPDFAIRAEEEDLDDPVRDKPAWILDPVDGTTNLMRHNQHSAISLALAYVACGRYDGFFEQRLQPWDFAAGLLMVQEAGGCVCNWQGLPLDIHHPDSLLASNGKIQDALFELVCDH